MGALESRTCFQEKVDRVPKRRSRDLVGEVPSVAIEGEVTVRSPNVVRSDPEERQANAARFDVDLLQLVNGPAGLNPTKVDVSVQHKNFNESAPAPRYHGNRNS